MLLTGATGFLGSYILRELLEGPTKAHVIAHVRAKTQRHGLARLETVMTGLRSMVPTWTAYIQARSRSGDISKPQLGLSQNIWDRLFNEVDVFIHNGAQVNWMLPYSSLRAANVLSTLACIQLCVTGKPSDSRSSAQPRRWTTTTTSNSLAKAGAARTGNGRSRGQSQGLGHGYGQSKWASELLVREAGRRGLAGAVIRPGYVTADPRSGISVTDDFLVRLWKGSLQVGRAPNIANSRSTPSLSRRSVASLSLRRSHLPAATGRSWA